MLGPALCLAPLSAAQELETGGVCCALMDAYSLYDAFPCEWDFRLAYAIEIATLEEPILVTALYREETGAVFAKTRRLSPRKWMCNTYLLANIEAFWGRIPFASTFYVRQEDGSFAKEARGFDGEKTAFRKSTETLRQRREIVTAQWREKRHCAVRVLTKSRKNEAHQKMTAAYVISWHFAEQKRFAFAVKMHSVPTAGRKSSDLQAVGRFVGKPKVCQRFDNAMARKTPLRRFCEPVPIKPAKRRLPWHTPQLARATCGHTGHFGAGALRAFLLPRRGRLPARRCGLRA